MRNKGPMAIVTVMVLGLASLAVGQQNSGRAVHITLKAPAQVGSTTLPAGDYEVTHLYSQTGHYMEFARETQSNLGFEGSPTYYDREIVARVDCTMQPASARIGKTTVEKEGARIAKLEIKGESVVHNF
jgi:Protein of unknown function (DUF2911)